MIKRLSSVNLLMSVMFLLNTILPVSAFSYEVKSINAFNPDERVDESTGYEPVLFKKARCPRCGMEFYYIPGKESPHSHWVHYEIPEEKTEDGQRSNSALQGDNKDNKTKEQALLSFKKEKEKEKENNNINKSLSKLQEKDLSMAGLQGPKYELRQKLTCPYDGYSFFPEGDIIEDKKMMKTVFSLKEISAIESSFAKTIPFGISKDLRQFGYDLFEAPEVKEKREEAKSENQNIKALGTLGLLKAVMGTSGSGGGPEFSFESTSSQTTVVPISPDYVLGPGDTIVINIWGSVQESFPIEVDREGKIMLPKAGPLYVWGLKIKDAEGRIKERLDKYYTNFYMDLSMGKLRDIQIYVMGEVKKPGSYRVGSQASIFHALYAAEGPTKLGSLRKIKLIHADGKEEVVDLYPFLLQGKLVRPSRVQSGDTIFVPAIGDVVAIAGNVKRPGIYETESEIPLQDLLIFAGGVTPTGDLQRIEVERIENNERRAMLDIELKREDVGSFSLENINMQNGDIVIVSPIVRLKHDFVSILGNVERPGDYALTKAMNVGDLLKRAKGFLPGTYLSRAEIARVTTDRTRQIIPIDIDNMILGEQNEDILLEEWDILLVYSESQVRPPSFIEIDGAVNRPGKYELTPNMKISDLIFKSGGIKPDEVIRGAELFHIMPGEQPVVREIRISHVSDVDIMIDKDIILRAGDALFVKSEPRLTERRTVAIKGEVRYPGTYFVREGEKLSALIERAGGFTNEAFLQGAVFTRQSIREAQEKMRKRFVENENRTILEEQQSILMRKGADLQSSQVTESLRMRREMLDYIQSANIEGRMVIKLMPMGELKDTKYDILLENGDAITIPQIPSAISVIGSVNNPTSVRFEEAKGVEYYIRKTGGLTKHADKVGIYIIKANGEALNKFSMSRRIEMGDTVVVPQEFKYWTPPGQLLRDTVEILSRMAIGVGIIAALD